MVFTQEGLNLLAKAQTGTPLNFTRIAVGDGYLNGQDETKFTALIEEKMSLAITNCIVSGSGAATVEAVLSNAGLAAGFYWREIGIFAQDPQLGEILYGYDNSTGHEIYVPPISQSSFTAPLNVGVYISNASSVTATIDPTLVYVKQSDFSTLQTTVAAATTNITTLQGSAHTHTNKTVLDGITAALITAWNGAVTITSNIAANVLGTALTGLSVATNSAITAADSVLTATGKLQAQITSVVTTLSTNVLATALTGLSLATSTTVGATDTILAAIGKLQGQINNISSSVLATVLTGLSTATSTTVAATDSILTGIGKLQAQITAIASATMTFTNKTLTAAKLASAGFIADANGNELIRASTVVTNAVNDITVTNAVTGAAPSIGSSGDDTNIDFNILTQGAGGVKANGRQIASIQNLALNSFIGSMFNKFQAPTSSADLTFSTNSTLASAFIVVDNLTINTGVTVSTFANNQIIIVKKTLTLTGTAILDASGKGGAGASAVNGASAAGAGGGGLIIYAKTIVGTGTIRANGITPANSTAGTAQSNGTSGTVGKYYTSSATIGNGSGGVVQGSAMTPSANNAPATNTVSTYNPSVLLYNMINEFLNNSVVYGAGAGSGATTTTTACYTSGGSGGSGTYGTGGTGGGCATSVSSTSGGSGGGGGGFIALFSDTSLPAITIQTVGGNGGSASSTNAGQGGGGGGGLLMICAPSIASATTSVAGGTAGATGYGGAASGGAGLLCNYPLLI